MPDEAKKYCPLTVLANAVSGHGMEPLCDGDKCAWWDGDGCAVRNLAFDLRCLAEDVRTHA